MSASDFSLLDIMDRFPTEGGDPMAGQRRLEGEALLRALWERARARRRTPARCRTGARIAGGTSASARVPSSPAPRCRCASGPSRSTWRWRARMGFPASPSAAPSGYAKPPRGSCSIACGRRGLPIGIRRISPTPSRSMRSTWAGWRRTSTPARNSGSVGGRRQDHHRRRMPCPAMPPDNRGPGMNS